MTIFFPHKKIKCVFNLAIKDALHCSCSVHNLIFMSKKYELCLSKKLLGWGTVFMTLQDSILLQG